MCYHSEHSCHFCSSSTRELAKDVYGRDVADDFDIYARDEDALDLFERSEYEARDGEGLTELLARAFDHIISSRADNGNGHQGGHQGGHAHQGGQQGSQNPPPYSQNPPPARPDSPRPAPQYHGHTRVADSSKNKKMSTIQERRWPQGGVYSRADNDHGYHGNQAHQSGQQGSQNPPPYSKSPRPDSPTPPPQYYRGKPKTGDSSKDKEMDKIHEERRSLLQALMYARADNPGHHGGEAHEGQQGGQNPPPYSQNPPPQRPDSPLPAPQYHGHTRVSDSSRNKKMPQIKERSFDYDWVMDLD